MKIRYGIIAMFFLLPGFIPEAHSIDFEFNQLCNVYWDYQGPIMLSTFNKSGLDIEDGNSTSVDVPVDVFCLARPNNQFDTKSFFSMTVRSVSPKPWSGNDLVLTNQSPIQNNAHYQIRANLCTGQLAGYNESLCVSTIGTPTSYVIPNNGYQKELVNSILESGSDESKRMDKQLCREHPSACNYTAYLVNIGNLDHNYRLHANIIIPRQKQIAPGTYQGTYTVQIKGKLRGAALLGFSLVDLNISDVQQPLTFKLNVSSACQVTPPTDVSLPEQMLSGKSETQDARAHVRCTYGTPYTVTFKGQNTDSTGTEYLAVSTGKNKIPYQVVDSNGVPWGSLGEKFTGTSENEAISFKVKTLPGENQPAGTYEDTVTMTVSYVDGT